MNDKVDISNTKLSVSEIALHKKVINTLEPNFLICPCLLPFLLPRESQAHS